MNRRDAIKTTAGAVLLSSLAQAADGGTPMTVKPSGIAAHKEVYEAALACIRAGTECLDHCIRSLQAGDKMLVECTTTVRAMLPLCRATAELALQDSAHLKALATISRTLRSEATLEKLRGARSRDAFAAVLMATDERDAA